jgi:hypothetical protein
MRMQKTIRPKRKNKKRRSVKTQKTTQPFSCITRPWTAWAARMVARHERCTDVPRLPLLLYLRLRRTPSLLYQRWLSFHTDFHPLVSLLIDRDGARSPVRTEAYVPRMACLQSYSASAFRRALPEPFTTNRLPPGTPNFATARSNQLSPMLHQHVSVRHALHVTVRHALPEPFTRNRPPQGAMIFAIARSNHLSSILHWRASIRGDTELTEIPRRLTQRIQRVNEVFVTAPQMALRKEVRAPVAPKHVPPETLDEQSSFERGSRPPPMRAMTMPAVNVEQLADRVLKQIDRRVVARRERMGQV